MRDNLPFFTPPIHDKINNIVCGELFRGRGNQANHIFVYLQNRNPYVLVMIDGDGLIVCSKENALPFFLPCLKSSYLTSSSSIVPRFLRQTRPRRRQKSCLCPASRHRRTMRISSRRYRNNCKGHCQPGRSSQGAESSWLYRKHCRI